MRYRLRTLMILMALGPPLLAAAWFVGVRLPVFSFLLPPAPQPTEAAAALVVPLLIGWGFSFVANGLIRLLVTPENKR
jgi:hypothetical protein